MHYLLDGQEIISFEIIKNEIESQAAEDQKLLIGSLDNGSQDSNSEDTYHGEKGSQHRGELMNTHQTILQEQCFQMTTFQLAIVMKS